jgi:putative holliday junction resolvase
VNDFLLKYLSIEQVEKVVIGLPTHADGNFTNLKSDIDSLALFIKKHFGHIEIDFADESFTSFESKFILVQSGIKKSKRQEKGLIDKTSAILILQKYLGHI